MNITGACQSEIVLNAHAAAAFDYLTNNKKLLEFNPFCKSVRTTGLENVYRWDFEIKEPQGSMIRLMFFVEQTGWEDCLPEDREKPVAYSRRKNAEDKSCQMYRIRWNDHLTSANSWVRDERTFLGHAAGAMDLLPVKGSQTLVCMTLKVQTDFDLPLLLRWIPESALQTLLNKAMTLGMEHSLKTTLDSVSRDFHKELAHI